MIRTTPLPRRLARLQLTHCISQRAQTMELVKYGYSEPSYILVFVVCVTRLEIVAIRIFECEEAMFNLMVRRSALYLSAEYYVSHTWHKLIPCSIAFLIILPIFLRHMKLDSIFRN
jgi:hypothetical protein